jgi:hypothetical protein
VNSIELNCFPAISVTINPPFWRVYFAQIMVSYMISNKACQINHSLKELEMSKTKNTQTEKVVPSEVLFHLVFNAQHLRLSKRLSVADVTEKAMKRMMRQ